MICPRCETDKVSLMVKSPVGNAWEMYICETCTYSWRSTESADKTDPEHYSKKFKINPSEIPNLLVIPAVPPLKG
jgi:protein-arginine kinase activator protein McsA